MKFRTVAFFIVAALVLTATSTFLAIPAHSAPAAQAARNSGSISFNESGIQPQAAQDVYAFWTPERMAAAQPMPLGEIPGNPSPVSPAAAAAAAAGMQPQSVPGHLPGQEAPSGAVPQLADGPQPVAEISHYYTYPFPYTFSYMAGGLQQLPTPKTVGKLFFVQNGGSFVCSGTVVTGGGGGTNRLIDTAGHCVHDGSGSALGWSSSLLFCPGYWAGGIPASPWGCWGWSDEWTTNAWFNSADFRQDFGFIVATHTSNTGFGDIAAVIGGQGIAWNQGSQQEIWSMGYPAASPFNGNTLIWTSSGVANIDDAGGGVPYTWGIGSPETGGSSGGGWLIGARFSALGYVTGHNDYKYGGQPLAMYSPPYDTTNHQALWNSARVDNP